MVGIEEAKMDWPLRLKVALGAARGLAYLHSSSAVGIPIVHRDFKSTNVLLSSNFEAKVIKNIIYHKIYIALVLNTLISKGG